MSYVVKLLCALLLVGYIKSACDHGWLHYGRSCYLFTSTNLTWYEASSVCTAHQAYLASIETEGENVFLKQQAMVRKGMYWLGGMDDIVEGEWRWSSSNQIFGFTDWAPSQPDDYNNNEDCLLLWSITNWQWGDGPCSGRIHFICEREYPHGNGIGSASKL